MWRKIFFSFLLSLVFSGSTSGQESVEDYSHLFEASPQNEEALARSISGINFRKPREKDAARFDQVLNVVNQIIEEGFQKLIRKLPKDTAAVLWAGSISDESCAILVWQGKIFFIFGHQHPQMTSHLKTVQLFESHGAYSVVTPAFRENFRFDIETLTNDVFGSGSSLSDYQLSGAILSGKEFGEFFPVFLKGERIPLSKLDSSFLSSSIFSSVTLEDLGLLIPVYSLRSFKTDLPKTPLSIAGNGQSIFKQAHLEHAEKPRNKKFYLVTGGVIAAGIACIKFLGLLPPT